MADRLVCRQGLEWIEPGWPAPEHIRAISTRRIGGVSQLPWNSLNLGDHVEDNPVHVAHNRAELIRIAGLPSEPHWLRQVHGCGVVEACDGIAACEADAVYTSRPGEVCVIMTADCLPVLITNFNGDMVAAAHAGWRGLCDGVLEAAISRFEDPVQELIAWLGPAISQKAFEVGDEVRDAFLARNATAEIAFMRNRNHRWMADIYELARLRLAAAGIISVSGGEHCTYSEPAHFFSYRRDGRTGRMATMIWIDG